jgi:predicted nucleotidyltransferase
MTEDLHRRIERAAAVLRKEGAEEVYLFGSARGGREADDSDVDLAVTGLAPSKFFRAMGRAHRALGCPLDLIDLDEDTPFTRYLKEEKELLLVR